MQVLAEYLEVLAHDLALDDVGVLAAQELGVFQVFQVVALFDGHVLSLGLRAFLAYVGECHVLETHPLRESTQPIDMRPDDMAVHDLQVLYPLHSEDGVAEQSASVVEFVHHQVDLLAQDAVEQP